MASALAQAGISLKQIAQLSHPLAAANHYQWIRWQVWVLPHLEQLTANAVPEFVRAARASGLDSVLEQDARSVIALVGRTVGSFAYPPSVDRVVERKLGQFEKWVTYAVGKSAQDHERWLFQCRTPFLRLPIAMRPSDYRQAATDLKVVAEAGGLVLPESLPMVPMGPLAARATLWRHALGMHGRYSDYVQPWRKICLGCHRSWAL